MHRPMNILSRHRCFPNPRSPARLLLTTGIRQLTLAIIPSDRISQRHDTVSLLRQAPPNVFILSFLQLRTSFNESCDTIVPPNIIPQAKFFDAAFASATDIAWVAR